MDHRFTSFLFVAFRLDVWLLISKGKGYAVVVVMEFLGYGRRPSIFNLYHIFHQSFNCQRLRWEVLACWWRRYPNLISTSERVNCLRRWRWTPKFCMGANFCCLYCILINNLISRFSFYGYQLCTKWVGHVELFADDQNTMRLARRDLNDFYWTIGLILCFQCICFLVDVILVISFA